LAPYSCIVSDGDSANDLGTCADVTAVADVRGAKGFGIDHGVGADCNLMEDHPMSADLGASEL
jgi:hypothetical protein